MSNEQDKFEKLRLLLSIKRHEQPPPGFFNRLSGDIIAQLRSGNTLSRIDLDEQLAIHVPWLQQFWRAFERQPVFAGSFGVAVCALLLAGIAYHTSPEPAPATFLPVGETLMSGSGSGPVILTTEFADAAPPYASPPTLLASTGAVQSLMPSAPQRHPYAMPVNAQFR
jgi:hypothetical protein